MADKMTVNDQVVRKYEAIKEAMKARMMKTILLISLGSLLFSSLISFMIFFFHHVKITLEFRIIKLFTSYFQEILQ